jgi:hypothetical protein
VNSRTFQLTDSFAASGTARWVLWSPHHNVHKIGLCLHLKPLLLYYFPQVQISLQVVLLLRSFIHSLLVLPSARLSVLHFEGVIIIDLGHLVRVLEEVFLKVAQFLLYDGFPLVLVHLLD